MSAHARRRSGFTLVELPVVSKRERLAFTLVELLVVIAIIGTLVGLLLPAVQAARENARKAECANNQKQLGLGMIAYNSSKGKLPGYCQLVKRSNNEWVTGAIDASTGKLVVESAIDSSPPYEPPVESWNVSWAAVLLPNLERQDIWDRIIDPDSTLITEIVPIDVFFCPSDTELKAQVGLPGLSFSANTGAWDWTDATPPVFLFGPNEGDTTDNGVLMNTAEYQRDPATFGKPPVARMEKIRDGSATTIMITENSDKLYDTENPPYFTWLGGGGIAFGTEQQLGIVWVVEAEPQWDDSDALLAQERINRNVSDVVDFDPQVPLFARPASKHSGGVNVVFCDGHGQYLRDDIDYIVYQQLLTSNGRKCVDPENHTATAGAIETFRNAPPLSEQDYN